MIWRLKRIWKHRRGLILKIKVPFDLWFFIVLTFLCFIALKVVVFLVALVFVVTSFCYVSTPPVWTFRVGFIPLPVSALLPSLFYLLFFIPLGHLFLGSVTIVRKSFFPWFTFTILKRLYFLLDTYISSRDLWFSLFFLRPLKKLNIPTPHPL